MNIRGFIFDLDGVIVDTAEFHAICWSKLASSLNIQLSKKMLDSMRGRSRMDSLDIILNSSTKLFSPTDKINFAESKNECYLKQVRALTPGDELPGVQKFLAAARDAQIKISLGSSSKNAKLVLSHLKFEPYFDAICDGTDITKSKPDPEIFLLACERLGLAPNECLVFEDAEEGINAAIAAGCLVVGVGPKDSPNLQKANLIIPTFDQLEPRDLLEQIIHHA